MPAPLILRSWHKSMPCCSPTLSCTTRAKAGSNTSGAPQQPHNLTLYRLTPSTSSPRTHAPASTHPTARHRLCCAGANRVVVADQAGSGKTLAYLTPLVQRLKEAEAEHGRLTEPRCPRAVIICPTEELCVQVLYTARALSKVRPPPTRPHPSRVPLFTHARSPLHSHTWRRGPASQHVHNKPELATLGGVASEPPTAI